MIFANILVWMFFSLRSIGKSGFGFWNLDLGFCYRTRNPKRMSLPRNQSPGWIAMKKSESGLHGFPFYCSIGKPEKGFAKLFSWTVVFFLLIIRAWARPLFLRIVFQILFRILEKKNKKQKQKTKQNKKKNGKKGNLRRDISALKPVFGCCVRLQNLKSGFLNLNPDFLIIQSTLDIVV